MKKETGSRADITGVFVVPGKNDNGRRVVEFCAERGLHVGNRYFKHRSLHKYTRVSRGQDGLDMLRYVNDVKVVRGMARGLSDHHVVMYKVRLVGSWVKTRGVVVGVRRIRSEKLKENQYREGYTRSLERKGVEWDGDNNVEHMWEQVKWAREVYASVRVGGERTQSKMYGRVQRREEKV